MLWIGVSMCKKNGEFVDHLFLHFEVAKDFWNEVFGRMGISWVIPTKQVVDLLASWQSFMGEIISLLLFGGWSLYA